MKRFPLYLVLVFFITAVPAFAEEPFSRYTFSVQLSDSKFSYEPDNSVRNFGVLELELHTPEGTKVYRTENQLRFPAEGSLKRVESWERFKEIKDDRYSFENQSAPENLRASALRLSDTMLAFQREVTMQYYGHIFLAFYRFSFNLPTANTPSEMVLHTKTSTCRFATRSNGGTPFYSASVEAMFSSNHFRSNSSKAPFTSTFRTCETGVEFFQSLNGLPFYLTAK